MYAARDLLVSVLREQQRDIDVDALAEHLLNGRESFDGSRNLHHQVGTVYGFPQTARILNRAFACPSPGTAKLPG